MPLLRKRSSYQLISKAFYLSLALIIGLVPLSAQGQNSRDIMQNSLKDLNNHTSELVKQVQVFLQSSGRWAPAPQGQDMQLCQALQAFQQSVGRMSKDSSSSSSDLQQLQMQAQNVSQLLQTRAQSPFVSAAWLKVQYDLQAMNQALYTVPGFNPGGFYDSHGGIAPIPSGGYQPGWDPYHRHHHQPYDSNYPNPNSPYYNPYYPGYPGPHITNINIRENSTFDNPGFAGNNYGQNPWVPGSNPQVKFDSSQVSSDIRNVSRQTEQFVKKLTVLLQSRGSWPPAPGTPQSRLCENTQSFQQQVRKVSSDLEDSQSFATLQLEMRQLGNTARTIEQLLIESGSSPDVNAQWNQVRTGLNSTYQSFFSAGEGSTWR